MNQDPDGGNREHDDIAKVPQHDGSEVDQRVALASLPRLERALPDFSCVNYADYTWSPIDAASAHRLAGLDSESRCGYEELGYLPDLRRLPLGTFQIDEHRSVSFEVIPEVGEAAYSEVAEFPSGSAQPPQKEDAEAPSPLVRFLQVTDRTVPVPLMLSEFDDRSEDPDVVEMLRDRELVDVMADHGRQLSAAPSASSSAEPGPVWTCFNGGLHVFSATYCENVGISNCDNGAWWNLIRHTGNSKRYVSHSRIAGCSNYGVYAEHQFRYWSWTYWKWKWTAVKYPLPPAAWWQTLGHGDVKWWKHVGSRKRRRKIHIWRGGGSGYFRAWTAFHN